MKLTTDKKNIIERLKKQDFVPLNLIGVLENMEGNVYFDHETNSAWVENNYFNYITGNSESINAHIDQLEDGFYGFSGVSYELAKSIFTKHLLHWYEPTERFVISADKNDDHDWRRHAPYEIVSIPMEEARGIDDRYEYKQEGSFERICDAITRRPTSAIYIDGELASYVLVHEDNSIGYMFTLEKYRHMGLGYWVTKDILEKMKDRNSLSFVEINQRNFKSQGLAKKTGFEKDAFTPWFGIVKGVPEFFRTWDPLQGQSFIFTSMAHLREVVQLKTDIHQVNTEKMGEEYKLYIDENGKKAELMLLLDELKEAFILKVNSVDNLEIYEIVCAIAVHFTDFNAPLILPYSQQLAAQIGGIPIIKG